MEVDDDENESSSQQQQQQQQRKRPAVRRRPRRKKPRSYSAAGQPTAEVVAAASFVPSSETTLEEEEEDYSAMDGEAVKPVAFRKNSTGGASINGDEDNDPFAFCLRCKPPDGDDSSKIQELWWYSPHPNIPITVEEALTPTLMRWKATEKGMLRSQPPFRLHQIRKACQVHGVPLLTALSLRRHLIKANHPDKNMTQLQLGRRQDINQSAALFEQAVKECLQKHNVAVWTEDDQKAHINQHSLRPFPPTPDFVLQRPLLVKKYRHEKNSHPNHQHDNHHHDGRHQQKSKKHRQPRRPKRIVAEQKVIHCTFVREKGIAYDKNARTRSSRMHFHGTIALF